MQLKHIVNKISRIKSTIILYLKHVSILILVIILDTLNKQSALIKSVILIYPVRVGIESKVVGKNISCDYA